MMSKDPENHSETGKKMRSRRNLLPDGETLSEKVIDCLYLMKRRTMLPIHILLV